MTDSLLKHKHVIPFRQLGFNPVGETEDQVLGNCPFCGAVKKFYLNVETKMWCCKKCTIEGGFKTFVEEILKLAQNAFKDRELISLATMRQLSMRILKEHNIGYNSLNGTYLLPIPKADNSGVWDVRIYDKKKLMSVAGHSVGMLGWNRNTDRQNIWLCEGEWDLMAMRIILSESKEHADDCVLAVPGAGTFKQEWHHIFSGKDVHVMYDHDEPGKKGANKVYAAIRSVVKSIDFIHWPEDKKDGYDVRDYKIETDEKNVARLEWLIKLLAKTPPEPKEKSAVAHDAGESTVLDVYDGQYIPIKQIHEAYDKWLHLPEKDVLDVMFGTLIANRLDGDPLWLFLVAPPGGTKTELINSISDAPNTVTTSSLTARSLVSGSAISGGGDPSLVPKLNGKCLLVKDFTTILNMPQMMRDEIFGILRDAYDGKTEKDFGNGIHRSYKSKFGFLSGVTPAYEQYNDGNSSLGERFLMYKIKIPESARERAVYLKRAELNAGRETEMRTELSNIGRAVLSYDFKNVPIVPPLVKNKTISLAQYVSKMRGTVVRDKFTREITHSAYAEIGTRLVKQFTKMMMGIGMFRALDEIDMSVYNIVKHMAISTVPMRLEKLIRHMYEHDCEMWYLTSDLAEVLQIPGGTTERQLENLKMLGMLEGQKLPLGKAQWKLSDDALYLLEEAEIY